jgi:hypothetical protein
MIRWYDYGAALLVADIILTTFFTIPIFGAIIAYAMYEFGWTGYCEYRKQMEMNK